MGWGWTWRFGGANPPAVCWPRSCRWSASCAVLLRLDAHGASGAGVACVCAWLWRWQGASYSVGGVVRLAGYSLPAYGASGETCDQSYLFLIVIPLLLLQNNIKKDPGFFREKHHSWGTVGVYLPPCSAPAALGLPSFPGLIRISPYSLIRRKTGSKRLFWWKYAFCLSSMTDEPSGMSLPYIIAH